MLTRLNGLFTLGKFVSKTVGNSDKQESCDSHNSTCLGHLGQHDINRNDPICVRPPKVTKASKEGDMMSLA